MNRLSLNVISVKEPCTVPWETMAGDEAVRFCGKCQKNVYDLSSMTRDAAEALIHQREGRLCVRYFSRADGTVVTSDCTPAPAFPFVRARAIAACAVLFVSFAVMATPGCLQRAVGNLQYDPNIGHETCPATLPARKPESKESMDKNSEGEIRHELLQGALEAAN